MERTKLRIPFRLAWGMLLLSQLTSQAAEDQENSIGGVIYDRFWQANEFPLKWHFSQDGVINNDAVGVGTAAVSNADARTEINQAIGAWVAVGTANVSFAYQGETANVGTGCDRINVVTWSDTADFIGREDFVGRGITTRYIGPSIPLNDVNRTTVTCGDGTVMLDYATYPNGTVLQR